MTASQVSWRDPKRYLWLLGLLVPLLPLMAWGLVEATGLGVFWWFGPALRLRVMPVLDTADRQGRREPARQRDQVARGGPLLPLVHLRCTCRCSTASLVVACWLWAERRPRDARVARPGDHRRLRSAASRSTPRTSSATSASRLERWLSKVALAQTVYGHFFIEHNRGHHVRVATPEDPASSRLGESFWEFLPRTVVGSLRSAWELENERLAPPRARRRGRSTTTSSTRGR